MEWSPKYSLLEAKQKIEMWCSYQERCDLEVRQKLQSWNLFPEDIDILIADLISNRFLNEERFAIAYTSGKFNIKKWGRIKIRQHLKQKKISDYSIGKALAQIDEDTYIATLVTLAESKTIRAKTPWEKKAKLKAYLISKGYENELINEVILGQK